MFSPFPRSQWRRSLSALLFIALYRSRMLWLNLRYRMRSRCAPFSTPISPLIQSISTSWHRQRSLLDSPDSSGIPQQPVRSASLSGMFTLHLLEDRSSRQLTAERPTLPLAPPSQSKAARRFIEKCQSIPRKIALLVLGILATLLIGQLAGGVLNSSFVHSITGTSFSAMPQLAASDLHASAHVSFINASKDLVRISQLDPAQYSSDAEFNAWAYSACSTTSMTVVFNAYGHHYRITDVLKVEAELGEITPQLGLTEDIGIARTAERFGFTTDWGRSWTLDQVIAFANAGHPVIVGWPPSLYEGGHLVVVTGGDAQRVYLADSSLWNYRELSHSQFLKWWGGFAAIVTPIS